jgi:hypothetical protein
MILILLSETHKETKEICNEHTGKEKDERRKAHDIGAFHMLGFCYNGDNRRGGGNSRYSYGVIFKHSDV